MENVSDIPVALNVTGLVRYLWIRPSFSNSIIARYISALAAVTVFAINFTDCPLSNRAIAK
jgi:hypothetical protein